MERSEPVVQPASKVQWVLWPISSFGKGKARRRGTTVVKVVECIGARYELQDVEIGKVYKWCPAIVTFDVAAERDRPLPHQQPPALGAGRITWTFSQKS
jgi:hypothetical protein